MASGTFLGHIPAGRSAKLTLVFSVELGTAFVADHKRRCARILAFLQHQAFRFIQAQALLELERTQARYLPEMPMKWRLKVEEAMFTRRARSSILRESA